MVKNVSQNTTVQTPNTPLQLSLKDRFIEIFISNRRIIFIIICILCLGMILYIPHYNSEGKYVFFGTFYTKNEANYLYKYNKITSDYVELESKLSSSKTKENLPL